jgi:hypothetical protein
MKIRIIYIFIALNYIFCTQLNAQHKIISNDYTKALKNVTDVMVNDVTSPVAASRYYAYINLASYETNTFFKNASYPSFSETLNGFSIDKSKVLVDSFDTALATILSLYIAGEKFLPSGFEMRKPIDSIKKEYAGNEYYNNSYLLARSIVEQVIAYSKLDGFTKLSGMQRYTPKPGLGFWKPTPPVFMASIEPNWGKLRTFLIDSSKQFKTPLPIAFDTAVSSKFYSLAKEVYDIGKHATKQQKEIAMFWDCNPFAVEQIGHVEFGLKKISPGGHWLGIVGIACNSKKLSLTKTVLVHALLSVTLADAFITCWQEKYTSDRVRPVTVIQYFFNPKWQPLLQTPPFPEYVSGHSVASSAAAIVLTKIFGDGFAFTDNTEVEFGLPIRKFSSFNAAAKEASISRLYGGIHFKDAIDNGIWLGDQVGLYINQKTSSYIKNLK